MDASLNSKRLTCLFGRWLVLIIIVSMLIGCKTANYGKFKQSPEVEKIFTSAQVLSDHKYYYTGSNSRPSTVMGINKNYTLDDEYWDKAKDIQKELKLWVGELSKRANVWGYYILAPDSQQIGIYYSHGDAGSVKMGENNQVTISVTDRFPDGDGGRGK
jgi:hypothetical protein